MIIEKAYNLDQTIISESDLSEIKSLLEKYEAYELFDILNEKRKDRDWKTEYKGKVSSDFDRTGGSTVRGLSGILQSVPSFAITALISPTIAVLAGLGALSHRMRQRWEDKQSWRNRLLPGFWVDNLANPGNYSVPHRVVAAPIKVAKGAGALALGTVAGVVGWDKIKQKMDEKGENAPSWLKKLFGIGVSAGVYKGLKNRDSSVNSSIDASVDFDEDFTLTPEDVKNIDFKEYWLTFSNNEVYRVKADTPENAKALGTFIISVALLPNGFYDRLNREIKRRGLKRYEFYFDDGEMCYSTGKDQKDAMDAALKYRAEICRQLNNSDNGLMPIEPLVIPKIYGSTNPKKGVEIPLPDKNKITVSSEPPKRKAAVKKTLKVPAYAYEGMEDYKVSFMNCKIHFPAFNRMEIDDMVKVFARYYGTPVLAEIDRNAKRHDKQFKVKMGDGDFYYLYAPTKYSAEEYSLKIHDAKLKSAMRVLRKQDPLENFIAEYGNLAKEIKSVTEVNMKDWKEYKVSNKVGIRKIASPQDDTIEIYDTYELR